MSDPETTPSPELLKSVWAEARDLIGRLETSTVSRLSVAAGDCVIEIERALTQAAPIAAAAVEPAQLAGPVAQGAGPGPGVAPEARSASGAFAAIGGDVDLRVPVLAPLVGTFYRSAQPGSKSFVEEGDVVDVGQTVCIVEAMKLMNEVGAGEGGRVSEILVENGDPVEYEQVLMYLEPVTE
jgi:acetyl-CoA carboxylase biotin carboxyl carrier protein